jgi:Ca2+-binding RTX toxin-like protein
LIGGAGLDIADYSASAEGVYVDLVAGLAFGGDAEGDSLSEIENLRGSIHDDVLIGNADTTLLDGNGGNDILDYSASNGGIIVNLGTNEARGGYAEGDVILNFESLRGSALADNLLGTVGNNVLEGGDGADRVDGSNGDDTVYGGNGNDAVLGGIGRDAIDAGAGDDGLTGGLGADLLSGGLGRDTAYYRKSTAAVDVSLTRGNGHGGEAEGDTLTGVEALVGSAYNDTLEGDAGNNRLNGGAGADALLGLGGNDTFLTGGGYDSVNGGLGSDTVSYDDSWDFVWVNMLTGDNKYGAASRDVFTSVENIEGSSFNDRLTGDNAANKLTGGAGDDSLIGNGGIDYFYEGAGNDTLTGGAHADVFVFEGVFNNDTITDFWAGATRTDRVWFRGDSIDSYAELVAATSQTSAGVLIDAGAQGTVLLKGLTIAQLHADDFLFT